MTDLDEAAEFVQKFIQHADYDPVKAHEYYMQTRQLKGRKPAQADPPPLPKTQAGYPGKPHKLGTMLEEDMSPMASPRGAKLTAYDSGPHGLGRATYADGNVYDAKTGWANNHRINAAESKLIRARTLATKVKDPKAKTQLMNRISAAEEKLKTAKTVAAKKGAS